ncbi:MAG: hypothetical protein ACE5D7_02415 [Fidelibacterota bacterium]
MNSSKCVELTSTRSNEMSGFKLVCKLKKDSFYGNFQEYNALSGFKKNLIWIGHVNPCLPDGWHASTR